MIRMKDNDSIGDLKQTKSHQLDTDGIFVDFWHPVFEDFLCLIHIFPLKEVMDKVEQTVILSALKKYDGNQRKTAKFLKVNPTTLCEKLKRHNISVRRIFEKE